jgi:hypothetical protein
VKKRSQKPTTLHEFDANGLLGAASATEEVSRESSRLPDSDPAPSPAERNEHAPESEHTDAAETEPTSVVPPEEPNLAAAPPDPPPAPALTLPPASDTNTSLEVRVRRLEEAVKEIQETRVTDRPAPSALSTSPLDSVVAPVNVAAPTAAPPPPSPPAPASSVAEKRPWLLTDMWAEARAIQYMFFDPRYRMPWGGQIIPLLLLAAFMTTGFWLPGAGAVGIGWIIEKCVGLLLGFALFKSLSREARRYRQTAPDLPPSLRL